MILKAWISQVAAIGRFSTEMESLGVKDSPRMQILGVCKDIAEHTPYSYDEVARYGFGLATYRAMDGSLDLKVWEEDVREEFST